MRVFFRLAVLPVGAAIGHWQAPALALLRALAFVCGKAVCHIGPTRNEHCEVHLLPDLGPVTYGTRHGRRVRTSAVDGVHEGSDYIQPIRAGVNTTALIGVFLLLHRGWC